MPRQDGVGSKALILCDWCLFRGRSCGRGVFVHFAFKCVLEYLHLLCFFKGPPANALVPLDTGCPLSQRLIIIIRSVLPQTVWLVGVRSMPFFFLSWSEE